MKPLALALALLALAALAPAAAAAAEAEVTIHGSVIYKDKKPVAATRVAVMWQLPKQDGAWFDAVTAADGTFTVNVALASGAKEKGTLLVTVGRTEFSAKVSLDPGAELWIKGPKLKLEKKAKSLKPLALKFKAPAPSEGKPTFVKVPAGKFTMGSPTDEPGRNPNEIAHQVTLTVPFEIMTTEVTQAAYARLMGKNPSSFLACGLDCPVEQVSFPDACLYANALSAEAKLEECFVVVGEGDGRYCSLKKGLKRPQDCAGYRFPTEAEWEYAARAGTSTAFASGPITGAARLLETGKCEPDAKLDLIGWYCGNAKETTHPVAKKQANAWGIYDMSGNVNEWVWDLEGGGDGAEEVTDPVYMVGVMNTVRGGNWYKDAREARAAAREFLNTYTTSDFTGFRLVRSLSK